MSDLEFQDKRDTPVFIHSELDDYGLTNVEFRVYARMARRAGAGAAFESVTRMAADFDVSDRTIQRAIRVLVQSRLISEMPRPGKTTLYTLNPRSLWMPKEQLKALREEGRPKLSGDTTEGGGVVTPERGVVVTPQRDEGTPREGTPEREDKRANFLPEWLDPKSWAKWVVHRQQIKKPITQQQAEAQFRTLEKFRARGMPPEEVIEQAVANGWQGLYELKQRKSDGQDSKQRTTYAKPPITRDFSKYPARA